MSFKSPICKYLIMLSLLASIALISYGWIISSLTFALIGIGLYYIKLFEGFISIIILSLKYKNGKDINPNRTSILDKINGILEFLIALSGMFVIMSDSNIFKISGWLIWGVTLLFYIISGLVAGLITNLPLTMTYGGWKIRYPKRRR